MNPHYKAAWAAGQHMADSFFARLPSLAVAVIAFLLFYFASILLSRIIRRATHLHRPNLGVAVARLAGAGVVMLGVLVAFSIVAPSFQAGGLIKVLGIGSVAIGFAFQNILQNFLVGLLLLWPNLNVLEIRSNSTVSKEPWRTFKPERRRSKRPTENGWLFPT